MALNFIRNKDVVLHVGRTPRGGGRPIVFINSLGTDGRIWNAVAERLGAQFACHTYDKRGHGLSDAPPAPYRLEEHASDLGAVLDHFRLEKPILCGLSVGGMIAQLFTARHPERVGALILSNTAHIIGPPDIWHERIAAVRANGIESLADGVMQRWFSPGYRAECPTELRGWRNMLVRTPVEGYVGTAAAIAAEDLTESTRGIRAPTLCIAGSEDGSTPPALMRQLHALIGRAKFELIDGVGHIPCVERPDRVADLIATFIKESGID
ncbi:MAG: 3-oxoadipate enol-lactonase [Flavobacteriaceae bacterium]